MLDDIKGNDWFKHPILWNAIQWYVIGLLVSDLSICDGGYARRWASNLSFLKPDSVYLICGNKDEIIEFVEKICKKQKIPNTNFHFFQVKGNKDFLGVEKIELAKSQFKGTRESDIHYKIFIELENEFICMLKKYGFIFDNDPTKKGVYEKHIPIKIIDKLNPQSKIALFAGMFDGDGSIGAMLKCSNCSWSGTLRKNTRCPECDFEHEKTIRNLTWHIDLDSRSSLLEEELSFISKTIGMKGWVFIHLRIKEFPTGSEVRYKKNILLLINVLEVFSLVSNFIFTGFFIVQLSLIFIRIPSVSFFLLISIKGFFLISDISFDVSLILKSLFLIAFDK